MKKNCEKQFVKRDELKVKMIRNHLKPGQVAKCLDITRQSFWNKLNGKTGFTEHEMAVLKTLFGTGIFF